MTAPLIKKTLRRLADESIPPDVDLWPEIQQRLPESLRSRWPEQETEHRQIQDLLTRVNAQRGRATKRGRFATAIRSAAFVCAIALLILALAWTLDGLTPSPANEIVTPNEAVITNETEEAVDQTPTPGSAGGNIQIPTSTPTSVVTPTPVTYLVQEGTRCIYIAFVYGVRVQDLIQLNGLDSQCTLTPGQIIIIPHPTPTPTRTLNSGDQ